MCDCHKELKANVQELTVTVSDLTQRLDDHISEGKEDRKDVKVLIDFINDGKGFFRTVNRVKKAGKWFGVPAMVLASFVYLWDWLAR